jgi:hypothetical protein
VRLEPFLQALSIAEFDPNLIWTLLSGNLAN